MEKKEMTHIMEMLEMTAIWNIAGGCAKAELHHIREYEYVT